MAYGATPTRNPEYHSSQSKQYATTGTKKTTKELQEELQREQIKDLKKQIKQYSDIKYQKQLKKLQRERRSLEQNETIRDIKAESKRLQQGRSVRGLQRELRKEQTRSRHPHLYEGKQQVEKAYGVAQRGIQQATRRPLQQIASRFTDRGQRLAMPPSASLGDMAVAEASLNYIPPLQRQYFSDGSEQRDLIGQGNRDMSSLVETPETLIKKKNQQYY